MSDKSQVNISENPHKTIHIVGIKLWIALAAIMLIIVASGVWFFFGTIQIRQEASCFLIRQAKVTAIYAFEDCIISDISAEIGDVFTKGAVIARTDQSKLIDEINIMLARGDSEAEIKSARTALLSKMNISSPASGTVTEVFVSAGDFVEKGQKIATVSDAGDAGNNIVCYAVIPFGEIKNIKKGLNVSVSPNAASQEEYGNITGHVAFISKYPLTYQLVYSFVGNDEITKAILDKGSCFAVEISLLTSETTATGYEWTTSSGPSKPFGDFEYADATIIIREATPYDLFFK